MVTDHHCCGIAVSGKERFSINLSLLVDTQKVLTQL